MYIHVICLDLYATPTRMNIVKLVIIDISNVADHVIVINSLFWDQVMNTIRLFMIWIIIIVYHPAHLDINLRTLTAFNLAHNMLWIMLIAWIFATILYRYYKLDLSRWLCSAKFKFRKLSLMRTWFFRGITFVLNLMHPGPVLIKFWDSF